MDGGDAAQRRIAEIKRSAAQRVFTGVKRCRRVIRVRSHLTPILKEDCPGLGRNVRCRKMMIQIRIHFWRAALAYHVAMPVVVKTIEHHAIKPGDRANLVNRCLTQLLQAWRCLKRLHRVADLPVKRHQVCIVVTTGFNLKNQQSCMPARA